MTGLNCKFEELHLERLQRQYTEHGKLIIAFDFDDTVYPYSYSDDLLEPVREILRKCGALGHEMVCFTSNNDIQKVTQYLQTNQIPCDSINASSVKLGAKVFYSILLDDKAGLDSSLSVLTKFLERNSL